MDINDLGNDPHLQKFMDRLQETLSDLSEKNCITTKGLTTRLDFLVAWNDIIVYTNSHRFTLSLDIEDDPDSTPEDPKIKVRIALSDLEPELIGENEIETFRNRLYRTPRTFESIYN